MLHFYVVMLQIYIDSRNLGGYTSYFESLSISFCGQVYTVSIEAYGRWAGEIISISRLIHIYSIYHPEFGDSAVGDKCHQMRFLI